MKCIACLLVASLLPSLISAAAYPASPQQDISELYSFENDMEGWSINGADLSLNEPTADEWAITRSQDMAADGLSAVKFDLTNNNDQGKIWIEKPFLVEPNRLYEVNVSYSFASADGELGTFAIITGVLKQRPGTFNDLIPAFRESTDKLKSKPGYRWLDKHYEFAVSSGQDTSLWVVIGIWGTFEIRNIYYVDSVRVEITPKPEGSQFYSFENDAEGWTANTTDVGPADWSISPSPELRDDGAMSLKLDLNNMSGKGMVWIARAFAVEPGSKYRLSLDYSFSGRFREYRIIAGVFRSPPMTADDLSSTFQDDIPKELPRWIHRSYQFSIKSKRSSTVYVVIGVMGTKQTHREYFIDSVCVTLTPK
ncbi:MAG: hypothetical protein AABN33_04285 [Acidobacteriota bacterium]